MPGVARVKALMSIQLSMDWVEGFHSPTRFGRSLPRTAWSDEPRLSVTVTGNPLRAWKIPLRVQPPRTASSAAGQLPPHVWLRPNGSS